MKKVTPPGARSASYSEEDAQCEKDYIYILKVLNDTDKSLSLFRSLLFEYIIYALESEGDQYARNYDMVRSMIESHNHLTGGAPDRIKDLIAEVAQHYKMNDHDFIRALMGSPLIDYCMQVQKKYRVLKRISKHLPLLG